MVPISETMWLILWTGGEKKIVKLYYEIAMISVHDPEYCGFVCFKFESVVLYNFQRIIIEKR